MTTEKPRKRDFIDMREFLRASAAWAEANRPRGEWPWGDFDDDDREYYVALPPDAGDPK